MIDIIIPNWNGKQMLGHCLCSLEKQSCDDFSITVVDNGSSDGSAAFVKTRFPSVTVIEFSENRGFSAAVNKGIEQTGNPWILLLNNDTEVASNCIERLVSAINETSGYEFFALKMMAYHNRQVVDGAGDAVLRGGVGYRLGTRERDCEEYRIQKEVFGACAGAALYRRTLFDAVGLFDEVFFAYLEDVDFNLRAVRAGYRCCFLPDAVVYHIGSASSGSKINSFIVELSTRNNFWILCKHYSGRLFLRFFPAILVYQFFWFCFVVKKRQFPAYFKGVIGSFRTLRMMRQKRKNITKKQSVMDDSRFAELIVNAERQAVNSIIMRRKSEGKSNHLLHTYLRFFC